jgi:hypothetical protein
VSVTDKPIVAPLLRPFSGIGRLVPNDPIFPYVFVTPVYNATQLVQYLQVSDSSSTDIHSKESICSKSMHHGIAFVRRSMVPCFSHCWGACQDKAWSWQHDERGCLLPAWSASCGWANCGSPCCMTVASCTSLCVLDSLSCHVFYNRLPGYWCGLLLLLPRHWVCLCMYLHGCNPTASLVHVCRPRPTLCSSCSTTSACHTTLSTCPGRSLWALCRPTLLALSPSQAQHGLVLGATPLW